MLRNRLREALIASTILGAQRHARRPGHLGAQWPGTVDNKASIGGRRPRPTTYSVCPNLGGTHTRDNYDLFPPTLKYRRGEPYIRATTAASAQQPRLLESEFELWK